MYRATVLGSLLLSCFALLVLISSAEASKYKKTDGTWVDPIQNVDPPGGNHLYSGTDLEPAANLHHADLSHAYLHEANLHEGNLSQATMNGVYLESSNLTGANLTGAVLSNGNLSHSFMSHANLSHATFQVI
jgi:hypothetical protein